jgi:hypothetical protein
MPLAKIRRLVAEGGGRRLSPGQPLWELSAPWWPFSRRARRFEQLRIEILEDARALAGSAYLVIDENPQEFDVGGSWAHAHTNTWTLPDVCDLARLEARLLVQGDWSIYTGFEPIDPAIIPGTFVVEAHQVASFSMAHGVPLLIQAFHDNDPWRVWVEDVRDQQEAAA